MAVLRSAMARGRDEPRDQHGDHWHLHPERQGLQGTVKTLALNAKVRFVPVEKDNDKSWVIAGTTNVDLGAA